ncbi:MAG: heme lyase CcmF/NrfE family subunit [Acidimicrobiaceae bacterium]|nr:heme lyase CcmF/NrfE family subunit [Ilumatobacter sp.]MCB9381966.1 heme lyase CcmF/NrfE family subunit [Acidimicrobiaceae bacterium]MCO5329947.1 heme lyase CcmF/NrfE family subunit [Ilumatobacteraceae bacterium]
MLAEGLNGLLGHSALMVGLAATVFGALALAMSIVTRNPNLRRLVQAYGWTSLVAAVAAVVVMERALITRDWSVAYVQKVGSPNTPALFNFTALWSALEGSILLWLLLLAVYTSIVMRRYRARLSDPLVAWAMVTMLAVTAFFFFLALGPTDAFAQGVTPVNLDKCCAGPNPLLQNHVLVLFHPPILYLGYVGFTVPFAFAIGALVTGRVGEGWLVETRRWALVAWGFLTLGIVLGSWWSYEVLGWGGVWAWDPVENASFLPWLTGTAYIHSVMVQERRGMLRVWNLSLLVATFSLTILGTFLTRSGVVNSVHAFNDGTIGPYLLGAFVVIVAVSLGLIAWRGDRLRSPGAIDSPVSREGAFLANNVVFSLFAFVILLGTVFPLIVEAKDDRKIAVGTPFFDTMGTPIGLVLLFLMAIAPVLPWRKAGTELLRDRLFWPAWSGAGALALAVLVGATGFAPLLAFTMAGFAGGAAVRQLFLATRRQGYRGLLGRTNGGMIVHIGVILVAVGLAASNSYTRAGEFTMNVGDTVEFAGHSFTLQSLDDFQSDRSVGIRAEIAIDGGQAYAPAITKFTAFGMDVATPSVKTGLDKDIYLVIETGSKPSAGLAKVKIFIKPMIVWLWVGGLLCGLGTVLALFPGRHRRRPTDPVSAPIDLSDEAVDQADQADEVPA